MAWHRRDDRREDDDRGNLYNYVSIVKSRAHAFSDVAEEEYSAVASSDQNTGQMH